MLKDLPTEQLELCSQLDLLICHTMQRLIDVTHGLVLDNDTGLKKKRKYKAKREDMLDGIPMVVSILFAYA